MTDVTSPAWLDDLRARAAAGDRAGALTALEARATSHAGAPKAADKRAAVKALTKEIGRAALAEWARWSAAQNGATAKELAAMLLAHSYAEHPEEAARLLERLVDDANWEVREWAGAAAGDILHRHFDVFYPVVERWVASESQFVRRAVCLAVMGAADPKRRERIEPLFALVEPLLVDRAEEVKRNLGPFAVGACLLGRFPDETLVRVRRWAQSDDEQVRWNTAMVFVAANARKCVPEALAVLSALASDQRRPVWMATGSALKNLAKRDPERVVPELREWLKDERKLPAALALRHTTIARS